MKIPSTVDFVFFSFETVEEPKLIFFQQKDIQVLIADQYFSQKNGNSEE